jgi:hypothetical protein
MIGRPIKIQSEDGDILHNPIFPAHTAINQNYTHKEMKSGLNSKGVTLSSFGQWDPTLQWKIVPSSSVLQERFFSDCFFP